MVRREIQVVNPAENVLSHQFSVFSRVTSLMGPVQPEKCEEAEGSQQQERTWGEKGLQNSVHLKISFFFL